MLCQGDSPSLAIANRRGGTSSLLPLVVPVHGIALHAGGLSAAAAAIADGVAFVEVGADTIYWAGTDDAMLL